MGTIQIEHFKAGLDVRRLPECTSGNALIVAQDGHINRGGELEQRAAFVSTYALPVGATRGMAQNGLQIVVFSESVVAGLPTGVVLQQLVHPVSAALRLARLLSFEVFASKVYAIVQFEDGGIYHYYDSVRVTDWDDKRARSSFTIAGGLAAGFVSSITVNGVEILGLQVNWTGDPVSMAQAITDQITAFQAVPEYDSAAFMDAVAILAQADGTAPNGYAVVVTAQNVTLSPVLPLAGGLSEPGAYASGTITIAGAAGQLASLPVNGVDVLGQATAFVTDLPTTATAIADQINAFASTPDYTATASGATVTLTAVDIGTTANGFTFSSGGAGGGLTMTSTPFAGGIAPTYQSGDFVRTGNKKLFALTGSEANFSGLQTPTSWIDGEATGAGFIDMSNEASNAETLTSLAKYQGYYAFFSPRTIQIWYIDPDPSLNKQIQVLSNTGTTCPRSVVQYGDNDVFYLDESGVRSLKARDASNAAITTDTGVPIDNLIVGVLAQLSASQRQRVFGVVEPSSGRYWLASGQTIYVFSRFDEASINAWTTYTLPFPVEELFANPRDRRVYMRSGDTIYVYGGQGKTPIYDDTPVVAVMPYMDAQTPTIEKNFTGFDVACRGQWKVTVGLDCTIPGASDAVAQIDGTTYNGPDIGGVGQGSHIQMRFTSKGRPADGGPVVLSAAVIHYVSDEPRS